MSRPVNFSQLAQRYIEPLLAGDRAACRGIVEEQLDGGISAYDLLERLVWPTMERLPELCRDERVNISARTRATRLNRSITDQLCGRLPRAASNGKTVLIFCSNAE